MTENKNMLGCFVSSGTTYAGDSQEKVDTALMQGQMFRSYIYGKNGVDEKVRILSNNKYGEDIKLILFQFYVNPIPYILQNLKEIENYRKTEKSIGIPIIVNNENFFLKNESERYDFLRETMLKKLEVLSDLVKKKKLDTNMELLVSDFKNLVLIQLI